MAGLRLVPSSGRSDRRSSDPECKVQDLPVRTAGIIVTSGPADSVRWKVGPSPIRFSSKAYSPESGALDRGARLAYAGVIFEQKGRQVDADHVLGRGGRGDWIVLSA